LKSAIRDWIDPEPIEVTPEIQEFVGGHPLVCETMVRRGIQTPLQARSFLYPQFFLPSNPLDLPDLDKAVIRIQKAISRQERILIWGDFDVDGQTATTLLYSALRQLGADVIFHIPIRANETHGISLPSLQEQLSRGGGLLLTCDTGISAIDEISFAASQNIDTIITDHHTLPPDLPPAFAIINPQQLYGEHPLFPLCGVGVAYKLVEELFNRTNMVDRLPPLLDLVALGTIADLAILTGDNRWFVQQGLEILRTTPRPGIKALLDVAEVDTSNVTEEHISFILAPRLNALGRLGDANQIIDFLAATEITDVRVMAERLEAMNRERKLLCDQVFQGAQAQIKRDPGILEKPAIILMDAQWPPYVLGIVASRLAELYNLPSILFAATPGTSAVCVGSARSVEGINITQLISEQAGLLKSFGVHPMAAGLSLLEDNLPEFQRQILCSVTRLEKEIPAASHLKIDSYISFNELNLKLVEDLSRLAPFGPGNPPLTFATRGLILSSHSTIGKSGEHLQLIVEETSTEIEKRVFWWQGSGSPLPEGQFDLAYTARASNYRGQPQLQIEWINCRPSEGGELDSKQLKTEIKVTDYRMETDQRSRILNLSRESNVTIWSEGDHDLPGIGVDRYHLQPSRTLAIYTIPPGRTDLNEVLLRVNPEIVYLFSQRFSSNELKDFLASISSLIQHAVKNNNGIISIPDLISKTSHREKTIRKAVAWFASRGDITSVEEDENHIKLLKGKMPNKEEQKSIEGELNLLLKETNAFRNYYLRADPQWLIKSNLEK
jgi:single-stranded-DNA-specific exonuclease